MSLTLRHLFSYRDPDGHGQILFWTHNLLLSMKRFGSLRRSKKRKEQDGLGGRHQSEASYLSGKVLCTLIAAFNLYLEIFLLLLVPVILDLDLS